jgi:acyl carrier protein
MSEPALNQEIVDRLRNLMRDSATEDRDWSAVNGASSIASLGFDSLSILDLLYDVDQEFGVELEASDVIDAKTVGDVAALLEERGAV